MVKGMNFQKIFLQKKKKNKENRKVQTQKN